MGRMRSGEVGLSCELEEEERQTAPPALSVASINSPKKEAALFLYVQDPR